ncbi:MAG: DUF4290 domain-containing protein [Bacteroidota bacterium]
MEYNSSKELLAMPEYGRNVQELINYAKTIEDPEYRQAFAEKILDLMNQMQPKNKNIEDYRTKLWKHLFRIADYELDVVPPNGEIPTREEMLKKPEKVAYPSSDARFRHYGNNVQKLITKALSMEPGPKRDGFVTVIGTYMKLAYKTWNKDHYVSDEVVKSDLKSLSKGALTLENHISLEANPGNAPRRKNKRSGNSLSNNANNGGNTNSTNHKNNKGHRNNKYKGRK